MIHSGAMASGSPVEVASHFVSAMNDRTGQFTKALMGLAAAGAVSAMGIRLGMGILAWIVLPGVAITLVGVLDFVVLTTDLRPVSAFLFSYDGSHWGVEAAKQALLSAGVTLGAGLGVAMSLGAQAPQGLPWARSVIAVAMLDTAFLLVTAIIASALLFEVNVAPSEGLAAVFVALPYAFVNVPMGEIYGTLFFFAMAAISWSAALILMEPTVLLLEQEWGVGRLGGAILAATLAVLIVSMVLFASDATLPQLSVTTRRVVIAGEFAVDGVIRRMANAAPDSARRALSGATVAVSIVVVGHSMDDAAGLRTVACQRCALTGNAQ